MKTPSSGQKVIHQFSRDLPKGHRCRDALMRRELLRVCLRRGQGALSVEALEVICVGGLAFAQHGDEFAVGDPLNFYSSALMVCRSIDVVDCPILTTWILFAFCLRKPVSAKGCCCMSSKAINMYSPGRTPRNLK